jgi:hypothetical protein
MHAPQYEQDHAESLAQDWPHLPIPRARGTLIEMRDRGEAIGILLDPVSRPTRTISEVLGDLAESIGVLSKDSGGAVRDRERVVTHSYFGAGRGRYVTRPPADGEPLHGAWGDATGDLYINDAVHFRHIPEAVWRYELGGYPVLKKWLGYRQASRRGGQPLSVAEARHFRSMVQRLAALLVLHKSLDALYVEACSDAWTAEELGLR